jgi:hypothetical protein
VPVTSDDYWVYITWNKAGYLRWFNANAPYETVYWDGDEWIYPSGKRIGYISANGQSEALQWPSMSKLTVGAWIDASDYQAVDGAILTLANASEELVRLSVNADRKTTGYIKDAGAGTYTLTANKPLHPGFNLVTLSYERGIADTGIKLGVNGHIEDVTTAPAQDLLNATLALCVGAKQLTDGTVSEHLKNAVIDDVFIASDVISDSNLWQIFLAYITAAPLMLVEEQAST